MHAQNKMKEPKYIWENMSLSIFFAKKIRPGITAANLFLYLQNQVIPKLIGFFAHFSKTQSHILVGEKSSLCITSNQQNISKFEFWNLDCARKELLR